MNCWRRGACAATSCYRDDYLQTGTVEVYTPDGINVSGSDARDILRRAVRERLVRDRIAPDIAARVTVPLPDVRRFAVTRTGEVKDGGQVASAVRIALPLAFTVLFLMSVLMTSGYLLQGTATEKENKVVDVLLASANPDEILAGKLAGLGAAGLVQVGVWMSMLFVTGFGAVPLLFAAQVDMPWRALVVALPLFIVAFLFFGSLMLGTGSLGSNMREAQQLSMIWSLTAALPLMLMSVLIREPHGLVARILTWLPLTAGPGDRHARQHGRRLACVVGDGRSAARAPGCDVDGDSHRRPALQGRAPERRGETESARGHAAGEADGSVNRDGARGSKNVRAQLGFHFVSSCYARRMSARDLRKGLDPDRAVFERRTPDQRPISSGAHAGDAWPARTRTRGR